MNTDHRGNPVGGNHRPTPRLANYLAFTMQKTMNQAHTKGMLNAYDNNHMTVFLPENFQKAPRITPAHAQKAIDAYRDQRDAFGDPSKLSDMDKNLFDMFVTPSQEAIRNALDERYYE